MKLTREFEIADSSLAEAIIDDIFTSRDLAVPSDTFFELDWTDLSKEERLVVAKAVFEQVLAKIEKGW